jgi:serine phosphatase RsbU (regulator of sigma subunit)
LWAPSATLAEQSHDPLAMLEGLNRRLWGRLTHQFATCLAIYLRPNGEATAANAGHLPPYLNGQEVAFTGSLPLGLAESAEFEKLPLTLKPGDRLVLITDGIVEAQDTRQQLFGFDRTTELMKQNHSAAEVAKAAQAFGQEDDISVLSVRLSGG